ncbi:MAG: WD40 repeat domain-containing protein [Pseudolabrys sp.]
MADTLRPVEAGGSVVGVHFLGDTPVFVLGEQELLFAGEGDEKRVTVHDGGILCVACDGSRIVTGGDDGKVVATEADGTPQTIHVDARHRWIDHVALGSDGAVAWSAGKTAFVRPRKGDDKTLDAPSTVAGLAFAPKGFRLAIAHYNGVTLWFPNVQGAPEKLEWKGSHLGVAFSPDGKFLLTAMQEPMLHGWRLADGKHMRMSGYSARVRAFEWTADGKALATSGSEQLILWPFETKDGPMGSRPKMFAPYPQRVAMVACHPREPVVAVGYADGLVLLVHAGDGREIIARHPAGAPVTALGWNKAGSLLAIGDENGKAGTVELATR